MTARGRCQRRRALIVVDRHHANARAVLIGYRDRATPANQVRSSLTNRPRKLDCRLPRGVLVNQLMNAVVRDNPAIDELKIIERHAPQIANAVPRTLAPSIKLQICSLRIKGLPSGEPLRVTRAARRLGRGPSLLALRLTLLCRFLQSVWLRNRDGCECAEGGAQNVSLSRNPMLLGASVRAAAVNPQMICTFADSLLKILHHQVPLARHEPAWQSMVNEILISRMSVAALLGAGAQATDRNGIAR